MKIIKNIILEPVIKFEPSTFEDLNDKIDYEYCNENGNWNDFYKKSLEKIGIFNVEFTENNSWFISINEFNDDNLKKLVKWDLNKRFNPEYDEFISAYLTKESLYSWFSGGYLLKNKDANLIHPKCCVGFEDFTDWENIKNKKNNVWEMLWIGHPWVFYKLEENRIIISEFTESEPLIENCESWLSIDKTELIQAINKGRNNLEDFLIKIKNIVEELSKETGTNIKVFYEYED